MFHHATGIIFTELILFRHIIFWVARVGSGQTNLGPDMKRSESELVENSILIMFSTDAPGINMYTGSLIGFKCQRSEMPEEATIQIEQ
jgi:hypothetical protein